ncbi:MAG: FIST N-terminal domain-containing protein [Thermodesulfobacteriota bacterium]|nr:FIST N-terminal domain-containing protein [Thermodesulfobacteriota bacterium]
MKVGIGYCNEKDAFSSGQKVAENALKKSQIESPELVFAFCGSTLNHEKFFKGLQSIVGNEVPIVGGSAIGIITNEYLSYEGYPAGAAIIQSDILRSRISAVGDLDKDEKCAGKKLAELLSNEPEDKLLLILYDSIKIPPTHDTPPVLNASLPLIDGIEQGIQSGVPVIGAGVLGDYAFSPPEQFCGFYVDRQSVVGTMLTGKFKVYFQIMHGCTPLDGLYHRITKIKGQIIYELDGTPIVEIINELYGNLDWHTERPVSLLTIGINHGRRFEEPKEANYVNRLITGVLPHKEGIGIFEPDLEVGTEIQFMLRDSAKMIESAKKNSVELMERIKTEGKTPLFGMYIDCAGRTAQKSNTTTEEAKEVQDVCNRYHIPLLGFYSGVEVAPLLQKSRGLDWTGVLLVLARE